MRYTSGAQSHEAVYEFDNMLRVTRLKDWIDATNGIQYAYDAANRLTRITDYDSSTLDYAYDAAGRVTSQNDYHSNTTTYTYTVRNQLSTITAPGSKVWDFDYNVLGQPTGYTHPNGVTTAYEYDSRHRMTKIAHMNGQTTLDSFDYALDTGSLISSVTHADSSFWDYAYDDRYRLISAVRSNANETIAASYVYTYDAGDNLLTKVEPFEDDFNDGNYTGWSAWSGTWSAANNYLRMTPGAAATIAKANTDNDLELRFSYVCNDTSDSQYTLTVGPRYASSGDRIYLLIKPGVVNLNQRVGGVWSSLDAQVLTSTQGVEYTIRVVCDGQNVQVFRAAPGALEEEILSTSSCTVASTNNVSFTPSANADYSIDNIRVLSDDLSNTTTFAVNNANELTSMTDYNGSTTFTFDAWGRMTSKARGSYSAAYGYKYGQMLSSASSNWPGELGLSYDYSGNGQARERSVSGTSVRYRWDPGFGLLNYEDDAGVSMATHIGALGSTYGTSASSGVYEYRLLDGLGSVARTVNAEGNTVAESECSPFGSLIQSSGSAKEADEVFAEISREPISSLYYTPFRFYSSQTSRWFTRDPVVLVGSPNLYAYVRQNPVNATDPTGLVAPVVMGGLAILGGAGVGGLAGGIACWNQGGSFGQGFWKGAVVGGAGVLGGMGGAAVLGGGGVASFIGGVAGGALGGYAGSEILGLDPWAGALSGAFGGAGGGLIFGMMRGSGATVAGSTMVGGLTAFDGSIIGGALSGAC